MTCLIQMRRQMKEKKMNSYKIKYIVFSVLLMFFQSAITRPWINYINEKVPSNYSLDVISEVYFFEKIPFEKLLKKWETKEYQEEEIKRYEKYGIKRKRVQNAMKERLELARELVKNKFLGGPLDISPTMDIFDNRIKTMEYIALLGHDRFKRLVNKFGIKAQDDLFQCLCYSRGIAGTSLGYSPQPDKHCDTTDPCKGGNFGCVSKDFPKDALSWADCAKKYRTADGSNIFNRFGDHINVSQKERKGVIKNLQDRSQVHHENCLPSLSKRSLQEMQSFLKPSLAAKAAGLAEGSENICEEAVAVKLFLNEHQSKYIAAVAIEGIATWVLPGELYAPSFNAAIKSKVESNLLGKILGKTLSGALSFANNSKANMKLMDEELKARNMDRIYKGASDFFQTSKTWNVQQLKEAESDFQKKINEVNIKLKNITPSDIGLDIHEWNEYSTRTLESIGNSVGARREKLEQELKLREYKIKKQFDSRKAELLMQRTHFLLRRNIIKDYRIPFLEEGGCKKYLKNREASCKVKLAKLAKQKKLEAEKKIKKDLNSASKIPYGKKSKTNETDPQK